MAFAEDADITPFGMSCTEVRRRSCSGSAGEVPGPSVRRAFKVTPSRRPLRDRAVAAADARRVQLSRQVLRTAGSPHPCGIYGWARPVRMLVSTALSRPSLISRDAAL